MSEHSKSESPLVRFGDESHDVVEVHPARPLNQWEIKILRLLLPSLPGHEAADISNARVEAECRHCPTAWFPLEGPGAIQVGTQFGASATLHGADRDGVPVEVLLLPGNGILDHIEAWRADLGSFIAPPAVESMHVDDYNLERLD